MSINKQTPPAAINENEIYNGAETNNVESSSAQAPDTESEIEEERQQTRKNFLEEDKQLCRSYLLISLDVVHGTEQKRMKPSGRALKKTISKQWVPIISKGMFAPYTKAKKCV
ncbi:hypothetical protein G6F56_012732 [Rhizopus delemar]|nr:hypothetical protein G6F56_012732 [Rhizopus delemar]